MSVPVFRHLSAYSARLYSVQSISTSIQHVSTRLKGGGGGEGKWVFNIAVQQNRTDVEENVEAVFSGLKTY